MNSNKIILIGAGGHCNACIDVIEEEGSFEIAGILDADPSKVGTSVLGYPVIGTGADLERIAKEECDNFMITIGQIKNANAREQNFKLLKSLNVSLPVIISPQAHVSKHATIGEGTIVMHGAIVNAGAVIGECTILNTNSLIEHDARIGEFCHVSTCAVVNGTVTVGNRCFIGSNATVVNNITISENVVLAAGSVAINDVKEEGTYVGNPCRKLN